MTKLTTERLEKLQDDLLQFQDSYSDPADKENYDIFVDALHVIDEFKAAKEKLLAYEQAADRPVGKIFRCSGNKTLRWWNDVPEGTVLYAAPVLPKQPDVTLTNEGDITKIIKAAEKLVRCKGRYHSEQNYRALAALFGVTIPDLPPLPSDEVPVQPVIPRELCSFVTDADIAALHRFAECCDDPESGGHDLEKEQVQRLEKIGALQRSGRISYITDFGDYLISVAPAQEGE